MSIRAIDIIRERVAQVKAAPYSIASAAAPLIEERLRSDATTKRGNVPSFGDRGQVPIRARAEGDSVVVSGPDWVMQKAQERGQVDDWIGIIGDCAAKELAVK